MMRQRVLQPHCFQLASKPNQQLESLMQAHERCGCSRTCTTTDTSERLFSPLDVPDRLAESPERKP